VLKQIATCKLTSLIFINPEDSLDPRQQSRRIDGDEVVTTLFMSFRTKQAKHEAAPLGTGSEVSSELQTHF
jgi:hypothetical protein